MPPTQGMGKQRLGSHCRGQLGRFGRRHLPSRLRQDPSTYSEILFCPGCHWRADSHLHRRRLVEGGLHGFNRGKLELNRRLHARFVAGSDEDPLHTSAAQLRALGFQGVLARIEPAKAVAAISRCSCARLGAGGLIAHNHRHTIQRR